MRREEGPIRLCGRREQLDRMAVRVAQEKLPCSIRALLPWKGIGSHIFYMALPLVQVVGSHGKMVVFIALKEGRPMICYQVQLLICSKAKPRSGKSEGGARNLFESQHFTVKLTASLYVSDVYGNMVQLQDRHSPTV